MTNNRKQHIWLVFIKQIFAFFLLSGCASIQAPTGGPKDTTPPKILEESPKNFTVNFKADEINIVFDEFFKLNEAFKEISLSPAVDKIPEYRIRKKTLNIRLQDTLERNTTYTINFGRAIGDYNENNILKNYVYVFSTGAKIDSLSISGTVTNAVTKKPELDATVFLLPLSQDTIFGKRRPNIFTTTDSSGNFKLSYLRENTYRIYALKEQGGGDKIYNSANEAIAFLNNPIALTKDTADIKLEIFQEEPANFRITDRKIENSGRIVYAFNKQLEQPSIKILNPAALDRNKVVEFSKKRDTAYVWTENMNFDSITVAIQNMGKNLDTTVIRRSKRDTYNQTLAATDNTSGGRIKPGTDLTISFSGPVASIDPKKISLLQDSVPVTGLRIIPDSSSTRRFAFRYPWRKERQYILNIDDNAVTGLFGGKNKLFNKQYLRDDEENYGNLTLKVTVPPKSGNYVIELLDAEDEVMQTDAITSNTTLNYQMFSLGKYTFRVIYDENKNQKWDTGNVKEGKQPEKIWNSGKEITLRANWDLEEELTIPPLP
ncbi:Ig-like domain-containing domain [Pedobacter sp. SYSU D00535]|uniref:Ig-like domain-containing domain n=1 Tax=Pedobacter sp. SYSU D00535 TaxID=2810308 RepID=UPI001A9735F7|nr:Ig-like domain-containing domain [Pedobacter sp. SYSU D00535]